MDTHKYAFELVKAAREMPVQKAEELDHIKLNRFCNQLKGGNFNYVFFLRLAFLVPPYL